MTMFNIDNPDIKRLERDLKEYNKVAHPIAVQRTLNDLAFGASKIAKADLDKRMVTRNTWTKRSIRVDKVARTLNIRAMVAVIGSTEDYMERQEFGGMADSKSITTPTASNEGLNARPRRKLATRANKMQSIRLKQRGLRGNKRQRNAIAIAQAVKSGDRFVYLELQRRKGIFRIKGKRNLQIRMVHDLSFEKTRTPKNPWLKPAYEEAVRMLPAFYADQLRAQARRAGLFK